MNLIVDCGNSSSKVGIFEDHNLLEKFSFAETSALEKFLQNFSADNIIISSVSIDARIVSSWAAKGGKKIILDQALPIPVQNRYATPATLGVDRIAAICGAQQLFPKSNCLVVDAGTCITFDFLDAKGIYYGGSISPGLIIRFQAVHTFTARLPLVDMAENIELTGDSTETCIRSGVFYGIVEEIDGIISRYREKFDGLRVILCGGDAGFFENKLKASIFASPELVLIGLNSILRYNVDH